MIEGNQQPRTLVLYFENRAKKGCFRNIIHITCPTMYTTYGRRLKPCTGRRAK